MPRSGRRAYPASLPNMACPRKSARCRMSSRRSISAAYSAWARRDCGNSCRARPGGTCGWTGGGPAPGPVQRHGGRREPDAVQLPSARHLALGGHRLQPRAGRLAKRAQDEFGTSNIAVIVKHYQGATFGFASSNFYVAFLAALEVDRNAEKYFGPLTHLPETDSTVVGHCPTTCRGGGAVQGLQGRYGRAAGAESGLAAARLEWQPTRAARLPLAVTR